MVARRDRFLDNRGRSLDEPASSVTAQIPSGYGATGFQASQIIFPADGCWEVTGRAGVASLTFVVLVIKPELGPLGTVADRRYAA
jgi:hypothetical protein